MNEKQEGSLVGPGGRVSQLWCLASFVNPRLFKGQPVEQLASHCCLSPRLLALLVPGLPWNSLSLADV